MQKKIHTKSPYTINRQLRPDEGVMVSTSLMHGVAFCEKSRGTSRLCARVTNVVLTVAMMSGINAIAVEIDTSSFVQPVLSLTVDSNKTLSEALASASLSLGTSGTIVKQGSGTLTADDASGIGSFDGDIHIVEGGWSVGTVSGFGTKSGATWVYSGGCVLITDVTVSHDGETFHLAGTGKSDDHGWGAIRFPGNGQSSSTMASGAYGSRWILEDDATVLLSDRGQGFFSSIDLDLNGHELTVWRGRYGRISTAAAVRYGMFKSTTGTGGIVMENGVTFNDYGFNPASYASGNYLSLRNAFLGIWETKSLSAYWRLVAKVLPSGHWGPNEDASLLKPKLTLLAWGNADKKTDHDFNMWRGPVTLEGDLSIAMENQNRSHPMTFTNKVTGCGGFAAANKVWLYLDCPENDFLGGVTLNGADSRLILSSNGALPANGGPLKMTDSTVAFRGDVSTPWSLPDLELYGTSSVGKCKGGWKKLTVKSGADIAYTTALSASNLVLEANSRFTIGSMYSPADYYGYRMWYSTAMDGIYTFEQLRASGTKQDHASEKNGVYGYNWFNVALSSNYQYSPIGNDANGVIGYEGWVWCDGPDGTEWTFALSYGLGNAFYLMINDIVVWNFDNKGQQTASNMQRRNVAMKHGWNRFLGITKNGWTACTSSDNLWTLRGLCVDKQGRSTANSSDYEYISDPGDGSAVVYMCGDEERDSVAWLPKFDTLTMAGGLLDLGGNDYTFSAMENVGSTITNGNVTLTGDWVVDCLEVPYEGWEEARICGSLTFGEDAEIVVANAVKAYPSWPKKFERVVVTSDRVIERLPPVRCEGGWGNYRVKTAFADSEHKSIVVRSVPPGMIITVK